MTTAKKPRFIFGSLDLDHVTPQFPLALKSDWELNPIIAMVTPEAIEYRNSASPTTNNGEGTVRHLSGNTVGGGGSTAIPARVVRRNLSRVNIPGRVLGALLLGGSILLAGGCEMDSGTNPEPIQAASEPTQDGTSITRQEFIVGNEGDTIVYQSALENITVTLTIPAGALDTDTTITIEHAQDFPAATQLVSGAVFEFGPDDLIFNEPVDLTITYTAAMIEGLSEDNLRIHQANGSNWVPLLGTVDTNNSMVTASIDGFSIFALKAIPNPGDPVHLHDAGGNGAVLHQVCAEIAAAGDAAWWRGAGR